MSNYVSKKTYENNLKKLKQDNEKVKFRITSIIFFNGSSRFWQRIVFFFSFYLFLQEIGRIKQAPRLL